MEGDTIVGLISLPGRLVFGSRSALTRLACHGWARVGCAILGDASPREAIHRTLADEVAGCLQVPSGHGVLLDMWGFYDGIELDHLAFFWPNAWAIHPWCCAWN